MKHFKAKVIIEDGTGIYDCDGIEHEGRDWLVPLWLETLGGEVKKPERIVPLDRLPGVQKASFAGASYIVGAPIPKAVMHGPISQQLADRYGVILNPSIEIKTKRNLN